LRRERELGGFLFQRPPRLFDLRFLRSTSAFCSASCFALVASSSLVFCSSVWRVCSSVVSCCDCTSRLSVRIVASIVLRTTPIDCVSCSRKLRCVGVKG